MKNLLMKAGLKMEKKKYAVIGHPIGHTMSPFIHKRLFELEGIDADYSVFDITPEELTIKYREVLKNLDGYNITIPHKQTIIPLLNCLDKKAEMYGSVNTVKNADGIAKGFTTDPNGFLKALDAYDIPLKQNVVIVGTGGVARVMAFEAAIAGCAITIAVRESDLHDVAALAAELKLKVAGVSVDTCKINRLDHFEKSTIDLLINATPVGMYPNADACPIGDDIISRCAHVFDAIYNPLETTLVKKAKANGAKAIGGISMLVWQAVVSHEIWNGTSFDKSDIEKLCNDSAEELQKIF